jgi:magnesium chelatase subunit I
MSLGTDGLRGELTLIRAARALASFEESDAVEEKHLRQVAPATLRHRLRRNALDESSASVRVERAITELFGA